jgi:Smg protein
VFDILVYLVETYYDTANCPEPDALELKLKAAGFDGEDIDDVLSWLSGLAVGAESALPEAFAQRASFRSYAPAEAARLSPECRGLLEFLESSGVIDPLMRERIIERALALPEARIGTDELRIITLVVMWGMGAEPDALVFDELLPDGTPRALH